MREVKDQRHSSCECDTFVGSECKKFVIIHNSVEGFDSAWINITIEHDSVWIRMTKTPKVIHDCGEQTILPIACNNLRVKIDDTV